jgi:hypothetical protein
MPKSRYDLRRKMEVLSVLPINISYLMIGMPITMTLLALAVILLIRLSAFDPNATKYEFINNGGIEVQLMGNSIEFTY